MSRGTKIFRGANLDAVNIICTYLALSSVSLQQMDVVQDSVDDLAASLGGTYSLIITTGFVQRFQMLGTPFKMKDSAQAVDNHGACKLIDAAKKARVRKVILVSSILTNARGWGQEKAPG